MSQFQRLNDINYLIIIGYKFWFNLKTLVVDFCDS